MDRCESVQIELSAALDCELERTEFPELIDHVVECAECRRAWNEFRAVDRVVEPLRAVEVEASATGDPDTLAPVTSIATPGWTRWATAAILIFGLTLGFTLGRGTVDADPLALSPDDALELTLGEDGGAMDDRAFVGLAVQLLRADPRYHLSMLQLLNDVSRDLYEGSADALVYSNSGLDGRRRAHEESLTPIVH